MSNIIAHVTAAFVTMPLLAFFVVYVLARKLTNKKKKIILYRHQHFHVVFYERCSFSHRRDLGEIVFMGDHHFVIDNKYFVCNRILAEKR